MCSRPEQHLIGGWWKKHKNHEIHNALSKIPNSSFSNQEDKDAIYPFFNAQFSIQCAISLSNIKWEQELRNLKCIGYGEEESCGWYLSVQNFQLDPASLKSTIEKDVRFIVYTKN